SQPLHPWHYLPITPDNVTRLLRCERFVLTCAPTACSAGSSSAGGSTSSAAARSSASAARRHLKHMLHLLTVMPHASLREKILAVKPFLDGKDAKSDPFPLFIVRTAWECV
ncbi:unnamed protein product, partial [Amoebophrya sp. A25]